MMNLKEEAFAIWSPEDSLWSRWAKPVLFAYLDAPGSQIVTTNVAGDLSWLPSFEEKVALILDLPGAEGVRVGVALAARGYRPVPLYNAVPLPSGGPMLDVLTGRPVAAVDVLPIIAAIRTGVVELGRAQLSSDAPPAFLLDANRQGDGRKMAPDEFDNRSICFTTDFPSANFLLAHGVRRVLLVQKERLAPQADLAHVLRRWQDGGLMLERMPLDFPIKPERFEVSKPAWYGAMFQRALSALGFHRATKGGFGRWMPDSTAGG